MSDLLIERRAESTVCGSLGAGAMVAVSAPQANDGRTSKCENFHERARDVVRSLRENDLSIPQPSSLVDPRDAALAYARDIIIRAMGDDGKPVLARIDAIVAGRV